MKRKPHNLSIGGVEIGPVPRVVAVIWGPQLLELAARAREEGADLLEVRVDLFKKVNRESLKKDCRTIRQKVGLPIIATVRRKDEGGGRLYPEGERLRLFKSLIPLVDAVDIELRSKGIITEVMREAKLRRRKILISYHNLKRTPPDEELENIAGQAKKNGGDIVKIAALAKKGDDVARLMAFTYHCSHKPLVSISLGRTGTISRILSPFFGSCLAYAYVHNSAAPGQLNVSQLRGELKRFVTT